MRLLRLVLGFVLLVTALLVTWPMLRAALFLEHASGRVLDVFTDAQPDGRVRLVIAYVFTAGQGAEVISYSQGDGLYRPVPDPLVDPAVAREVIAELLPGGGKAAVRRVFYQANDPVRTAFIISPVLTTRRYHVAVAMALIGIALLWSARHPAGVDR